MLFPLLTPGFGMQRLVPEDRSTETEPIVSLEDNRPKSEDQVQGESDR